MVEAILIIRTILFLKNLIKLESIKIYDRYKLSITILDHDIFCNQIKKVYSNFKNLIIRILNSN